jgi:ribulose-phosphate 3-epimerase
MNFYLGIKSDPIEYRYTFAWLFELLDELDIRYMQLGSFFELYTVEDDFFLGLKEQAESKGIRIKSCFTSHRELGGFLSGSRPLIKAARQNYERYIQVASLLDADYIGSSMGSVFRDRMEFKLQGIDIYLSHMKELMHLAREKRLKGLTMELMSCTAEPPSTPEEIDYVFGELETYHREHKESTVPVYLCGDISHGLADRNGKVVHSNMELFEYSIPRMAEFHFKNTDELFNSTFGFSKEEQARGIVDLGEVMDTVWKNENRWPVEEVVGYYETLGPKLGRDYSDYLLRDELEASLKELKRAAG